MDLHYKNILLFVKLHFFIQVRGIERLLFHFEDTYVIDSTEPPPKKKQKQIEYEDCSRD